MAFDDRGVIIRAHAHAGEKKMQHSPKQQPHHNDRDPVSSPFPRDCMVSLSSLQLCRAEALYFICPGCSSFVFKGSRTEILRQHTKTKSRRTDF